jgi:hypothetical protein
MSRRVIWGALVMLLVLASCRGENSGGGDGGQANNPASSDNPIYWTRTPDSIVFRADVVGGQPTDSITARSEIPNCTIYGDNRVVWINTAADNTAQILFDVVTDDVIQRFVTDLTISDQIYTYPAGAQNLPPSTTKPVVETLTVNVSGREHTTDAFGGWTYTYYENILNRCKALSQSPVLFEPTEAWLSVQEIPYDTNRPLRIWDSAASGLDLAAIAQSGEPQWITGDNVRSLWNILQSGGAEVQLAQDVGNYQIALQIPNVTRDAPAAPN